MKLVQAIAEKLVEITAAVVGPAGNDIPVATNPEGVVDLSLLPPLDNYQGWGVTDDAATSFQIGSGEELDFVSTEYIDQVVGGDAGGRWHSARLDTAALLGLTDLHYSKLGHNHDTAYAPIVHNHDADYVNVSGDTMSGKLTINDELEVMGKVELGMNVILHASFTGNPNQGYWLYDPYEGSPLAIFGVDVTSDLVGMIVLQADAQAVLRTVYAGDMTLQSLSVHRDAQACQWPMDYPPSVSSMLTNDGYGNLVWTEEPQEIRKECTSDLDIVLTGAWQEIIACAADVDMSAPNISYFCQVSSTPNQTFAVYTRALINGSPVQNWSESVPGGATVPINISGSALPLSPGDIVSFEMYRDGVPGTITVEGSVVPTRVVLLQSGVSIEGAPVRWHGGHVVSEGVADQVGDPGVRGALYHNGDGVVRVSL